VYQAKQILVPGSKSQSMTGSSLIYALALDKASELFRHFGKTCEADAYQAQAKALKETIYKLTYDPSKQMLADTPDKLSFSQHANILGILTDVIPQNQQAALIERVANDKNIIQASTYFQFYLFGP
jgi:GH15 family glucan-1,4-alpha-glucosidase